MPPTHLTEAVIWTDARRLPLARTVVARLAEMVKLIGLGGPSRPGDAAVRRAAGELGALCDDDPRRLLVSRPAAFALLTTADGWTADATTAALAQGTLLLTVEPLFADLHELAEHVDALADSLSRIVDMPLLTAMPGFTSAADPLSVIGPAKAMSLLSFFHAHDCSLFARLLEAWRLTIELAALPEEIDCSISLGGGSAATSASVARGSARPAPLSADMGGDLRALTGHLTAHGRLPDAAGVVLQLWDHTCGDPSTEASAASWPRHSPAHHAQSPAASAAGLADSPATCDRGLHITGAQGRLRMTDHDYELYDRHGRMIDRAAPTGMPPGFAEMIVTAWAPLLRSHQSGGDPARSAPSAMRPATLYAKALACCHASLLSARTGQPVSPGNILAAHGWRGG